VWHVGASGTPAPHLRHHNIHFGDDWDGAFEAIIDRGELMPDPSRLVTVPSVSDPTAAPAGSTTMYVLEPVPHTGAGLDWRREAGPMRERLHAFLEVGGYPTDIREELLVTPDDWRAQGMHLGTPFALAHTFRQSGPFRPSNVDRPIALERLLRAVAKAARRLPIVFPVHPRTRDRLDSTGLATLTRLPGLYATPPLGYLDMLALLDRAELVLTDSGGVQEETTYLGVPCLTLRDSTERPATVTDGTNRIVGTRPERVLAEIERVLDGDRPPSRRPPLWDGRAAERVADVLAAIGS